MGQVEMLTQQQRKQIYRLYHQTKQQVIEQSKYDFLTFCVAICNDLYPFLNPKEKGIIAITQFWQEFITQYDIQNAFLNASPSLGKTFFATVFGSCWAMGHNKQLSDTIIIQANEATRKKTMHYISIVLSSKIYYEIFDLSLKKNNDHEKMLSDGRILKPNTSRGDLTGARGSLLIFDDFFKPTHLHRREHETSKEFLDMFLTREHTTLIKERQTKRFFNEQKIATDDVTGVLTERFNKTDYKVPYMHLKMPCYFSEDTEYNYNNRIISFKGSITEGEREFSSPRFNEEFVKRKTVELGHPTFETQYQQNPIDTSNIIIKREWFKFYSDINDIRLKYIFITCDTATKIQKHNDYSVMSCWGMSIDGEKRKIYLLDMFRAKVEWNDLEREAKSFYQKWQSIMNHNNKIFCKTFYIEDASSGTQLIQTFRRNTNIPINAVKRDKDKYERLSTIISFIENDTVYLPNNKNFTNELIDECVRFRKDDSHDHDDALDTLIDALYYEILENNRMSPMFNLI